MLIHATLTASAEPIAKGSSQCFAAATGNMGEFSMVHSTLTLQAVAHGGSWGIVSFTMYVHRSLVPTDERFITL
jgi:hypothetical protein